MEKSKKSLQDLGYIFMFFGIIDFVSLVVDFFAGDYSLSKYTDVPNELAKIFVTGTISILIIIALSKIVLGVIGIRQGEEQTNTKMHISLCKIMTIISIIFFIFILAIMIISKTYSYSFLISILVTIALLFLYSSTAKKCVKSIKK